jgi:integrase
MGTRDWEVAQAKVRKWEDEQRASELGTVTLERAIELFLLDAQARKLSDATIQKYNQIFKHLRVFATTQNIRSIRQLDLQALRAFRVSWQCSSITSLKRLQHVRAFFRFLVSNGWIAENPASKLRPPTVRNTPTLPLTKDEVGSIVAACEIQGEKCRGPVYTKSENVHRLRAFVLALRYTGMRIGDVTALERARVQNGKVFLYTQKTGTPVYLPLPDFVLSTLEQAPVINERYYFWSGNGKLKSAVTDWQRSLAKVYKTAGVPDAHAHRFRDTFAVELLLSGVPLERVSVLLGHSSVKITERHYAPWVRERQEQMEEDVKRAWKVDPLLNRTISVQSEIAPRKQLKKKE